MTESWAHILMQQDALAEEQRVDVGPPRMHQVLLINDDFTPMDFVVHVLEFFFSMERGHATQVMLQVHTKGKAVCGIYTAEIAETKASQVNGYARKNQHPLLCATEPCPDNGS